MALNGLEKITHDQQSCILATFNRKCKIQYIDGDDKVLDASSVIKIPDYVKSDLIMGGTFAQIIHSTCNYSSLMQNSAIHISE